MLCVCVRFISICVCVKSPCVCVCVRARACVCVSVSSLCVCYVVRECVRARARLKGRCDASVCMCACIGMKCFGV